MGALDIEIVADRSVGQLEIVADRSVGQLEIVADRSVGHSKPKRNGSAERSATLGAVPMFGNLFDRRGTSLITNA